MLFELRRRAITQGAVSAMGVIEGFDVVENHEFGCGFGWRNRAPEGFGFQGGNEAFSQALS